MWFIFIVSMVVVALAALTIIWIGHNMFISMKRHEKQFEREDKNNEI